MSRSCAGQKRILVVEDELEITRVCRRILVPEGYQVDIATNGAIAEQMLQEEDYDLIIIDIKTPVMNGKQLYQNMNERYPELVSKTIFTTGDVISSETQYFIEQTGRPFLPKPFTPEELKVIVRETLKQLD